MPILIGILVLLCVSALALALVGGLPAAGTAAVGRGLDEIRRSGDDLTGMRARRRRQQRSERLRAVLETVGERVGEGRRDTPAVRQFLLQAGFTDPSAVATYWAARVGLATVLVVAVLLIAPLLQPTAVKLFVALLWFGGLGWVAPTFYIRSRLNARQKELQLALPDMLDMLVVCVEAGLGLNQALVRASDEIDHVSPAMSEQLALVNLEIRAGTPRDEALRHFADRTGLTDVSALVGMLIQTDRFGTSVADALRIHSDTLRTKRRQRAEEAAAKTTIKLVFPLVLCVFPAIFVVVLAPSVIAIMREFAKVGH